MKILNFGSCNLDMVYRTDHVTRPGETLAARSCYVFPGGKGLNQSVALARAGAAVWHAGCVGEDGLWLKDLLTGAGVRTDHLRTVEEKTGHAVIQVDDAGANAILLYGGANRAVTEKQIREAFSSFGPGDAVVLQNEINRTDEIAKLAKEKGMTVFFNPSPLDENALRVDLDGVDWILVNETEAAGLCGEEGPEPFARWLRGAHPRLSAVLTLGAKGSLCLFGAERTAQKTFRVKVVDTTAAGDTFTGFFISALTGGADRKEALRLASAAASLAVSRPGAAPSIPTLEEVKKALTDLAEQE